MSINNSLGRAIHPHEIRQHVQRLLRRAGPTGFDRQYQLDPPKAPKTVISQKCSNVGVCVSGGPDSMALAYLLKNMPLIDNVRIEPMAIIIDHQAREGSRDEAVTVESFLKDIGIPATILTMTWPDGIQPLRLTNFESRARTRRYRLIAQHSLKHDIRHLFVGHHQDDQVETVMMRLIRQESPSLFGTQGISAESPIPCCDDIYGAHERSDMQAIHDRASLVDRTESIEPPMPTGLVLHRPLLNFRKADLVATCQENDVQFVIDATNKDPHANTRNAVRFLRSNYQLPKALSSGRLLSLQLHADHATKLTIFFGSRYLNWTRITNLDLRTGVLQFRAPHIDVDHKLERFRGLSNALSRLLGMVTPCARGDRPLQASTAILNAVFPEHDPHPHSKTAGDQESEHDGKALTYHRVLLQPDPTEPRVWTLSRQPMRQPEIDKNTWHFGTEAKCWYGMKTSSWQLWDNRFWLRVSIDDSQDLEDIGVRPYSPDPTAPISKRCQTLLKSIAPGKVKTTLPVLTYRGQAFALPTLYHVMNDPASDFGIQIRFWVRYKTIDHLSQLQIKIINDGSFKKRSI